MKDGHETIRELLALAAAGALDDKEARRVEEHAATCAECAAELGRWKRLGGALRRLPTPQPSAALIARVRVLAEARLVHEQAKHRDIASLAMLIVVSWGVALATWPALQGLAAQLFLWWSRAPVGFGSWLAAYSILGGVVACASAIALGMRARILRRIR